MSDLISRSALLAKYDRIHVGEPGKAIKLIAEAPAVDAAEVVRCEDCKRSDHSRCSTDGVLYCMKHSRFMVDDDFCSYGKRRGGDG